MQRLLKVITPSLTQIRTAASAEYRASFKNLGITSASRVMCQGFTGKQATFHCGKMINYGTNMVGGVSPSKAGKTHLGLPVVKDVKEAMSVLKPDCTMIMVPPKFAGKAIMEAIEAGVSLIVCITEGIPIHEMAKIQYMLYRQGKTRLIGPNCPGMICSQQAKIGILPGPIHKGGIIGVCSRSGTLTYEAIAQTTLFDLGQTYCFGIGGDPFNGTDFIDCLNFFFAHSATKGIILIGEIGGVAEEEAADYIRIHNKENKPVVSFIAGTSAPPGRRMGHAGAIISQGRGTAQAKIEALEAAGVTVVRNPTKMGWAMYQAMRKHMGLYVPTGLFKKPPVAKKK